MSTNIGELIDCGFMTYDDLLKHGYRKEDIELIKKLRMMGYEVLFV